MRKYLGLIALFACPILLGVILSSIPKPELKTYEIRAILPSGQHVSYTIQRYSYPQTIYHWGSVEVGDEKFPSQTYIESIEEK